MWRGAEEGLGRSDAEEAKKLRVGLEMLESSEGRRL